MTNGANGGHHNPAFQLSERVPIECLSPSSNTTSASFVEGDVALIWPFSSTTGALSILLADPNVRLRQSKGQVKILFQGACAREVARSKLGIGDTVRLSLEGAEWVHTGDVVSTPGRKIDWDLSYAQKVILEVCPSQNELWRKLTSHQISCGSTQLAFVDFKIQQEAPSGVNGVSRDQSITFTNSKATSPPISSPAFSTPKRQSAGSFVDASLDPFAEDDGFVVGKGRKRTKFARHSGAWKLLDDAFLEQDNEDTIESGGDGEAVEEVDSLSGSSLAEQTISAADSLIARNRSHWDANRDRLPQVD